MLKYNNEPDLLEQFGAGDLIAFETVYQQKYLTVLRFAERWVITRADAEDITADTFAKLWVNRHRFQSIDHIRAFLHVTVRNACVNHIKKAQVKSVVKEKLIRQMINETQSQFAVQEIRQELMKLIYAEVEKMPSKMKEIFMLSYSEGLKPMEIAQKLKLSVQTVSNQKTNAIRLLKIALANKPILLAFLISIEYY
ncbi:MAG: RNA polymerase sigma-70 factor [Niabella sp.]|nr:RNA polymerase sigma-70 factor [Niabella sp.]